MQVTAVLCLRNEGAFVLDWLAHHLACGVTHVVALTNDCQDGTDALLDRLAEIAPVTHLRNDGPYDKGGIQFTGLKLADRCDAVQQADWLVSLDIDEFINIHLGARRLPDLFAAHPEATGFALTWRLFGNGGVVRYEDQPIPQQFTRAAPHVMPWPWRAAMFKTLYRNDGTFGRLGVHRPRRADPDRLAQARWIDGAGRALPTAPGEKRVFSDYRQNNHTQVQLNHYPLGAIESYLLKVDRGRAVHAEDRLGMDYWIERNWTQDEDRSILGLAGVAEQRAALAGDAQVAELHARAVAWRHTRLKALLAQEPYRALFGRLLMAPPSRVVSQAAARMLTQHGLRAARSAPTP